MKWKSKQIGSDTTGRKAVDTRTLTALSPGNCEKWGGPASLGNNDWTGLGVRHAVSECNQEACWLHNEPGRWFTGRQEACWLHNEPGRWFTGRRACKGWWPFVVMFSFLQEMRVRQRKCIVIRAPQSNYMVDITAKRRSMRQAARRYVLNAWDWNDRTEVDDSRPADVAHVDMHYWPNPTRTYKPQHSCTTRQ